MKDHEIAQGECEVCHQYVGNDNLYVDIINHVYALECPECFYKNHEGDVNRYYEKIKEIKPDILSKAQFNKHSKGFIVIANAFPFIVNGAVSLTEKESYSDQAIRNFLETKKMIRKFTPIQVKMKHSEQVGMFIVLVTAKVRFRSYLEFLEHELYMLFRKETKTVFS